MSNNIRSKLTPSSISNNSESRISAKATTTVKSPSTVNERTSPAKTAQIDANGGESRDKSKSEYVSEINSFLEYCNVFNLGIDEAIITNYGIQFDHHSAAAEFSSNFPVMSKLFPHSGPPETSELARLGEFFTVVPLKIPESFCKLHDLVAATL